ncbi:MAG: hypothetical protein ACRELY_27160 [Polyangiaceae bacterium]
MPRTDARENREQLALVRTLLDEVERALGTRAADDVEKQLVEELSRLGCQLLEASAALVPESVSVNLR